MLGYTIYCYIKGDGIMTHCLSDGSRCYDDDVLSLLRAYMSSLYSPDTPSSGNFTTSLDEHVAVYETDKAIFICRED